MHGAHHQDEMVMDPGDGFSFIIGVLLIIIIFLICKGCYRMCCSSTIRPGRPRGDSQCAITHHFSMYFFVFHKSRQFFKRKRNTYWLLFQYKKKKSKQFLSHNTQMLIIPTHVLHHDITLTAIFINIAKCVWVRVRVCGCFCVSILVRVFRFGIRSRKACDLTHIETWLNSIRLLCIDCQWFSGQNIQWLPLLLFQQIRRTNIRSGNVG